jgi:hypothetical protein
VDPGVSRTVQDTAARQKDVRGESGDEQGGH